MNGRQHRFSPRGEVTALVVSAGLSLLLLFLPGDSRVLVADRLSVVLTDPWLRVRGFANDVVHLRAENAELQRQVAHLELATAAAAREVAAAGLRTVDAWVRETDGISWRRPDGTGFGCVRLPDGIDDVALAEYLHDRENVLLVPGTWFEAPGTIRVSWLQSGGSLVEGLSRTAHCLRDWPSIPAANRANDSTGPSSRCDKRLS